MAEKAVLLVFLNLLLWDSRASGSGPRPGFCSFHLESQVEVCCHWLSLGSENPSGVCLASLPTPSPQLLSHYHFNILKVDAEMKQKPVWLSPSSSGPSGVNQQPPIFVLIT